MESRSPPPPLPQSYDDAAVCLLYPLHDPFVARELGQRRFSKTQEGEWFARIANDVRSNERATDTAKRWLKAISLSNKQEFRNFVPPLTGETFEQFVQFFWLIKADDRLKANQLLSDIRRQWDIEGYFYPSTFNDFLASGDAAAFTGQVTLSTGKSTLDVAIFKAKSRKINAVGRKQNRKHSSSAITSPATAKPSLKKKRKANARPSPRATTGISQDEGVIMDKDVAGPGKVVSDSGVTRQSKKRKAEESLPLTIKIPPGSYGRREGKMNAGELGGVEHGGVSDGPEHRQRSVTSVTKSNPFHIIPGASLVPKPGILSSSNPNPAHFVGADERVPKRANPKKKPARKRRPSGLNTSQLGYGMDHTTARGHESHVDGRLPPPSFTFNDAGEKDLEEEGFPYDSTLSEYPVLSSVVSDKEQRVSRLPRPKLPDTVTPPIWAQSRQEVCESLDYFRSYQGGVYHSHDTVKGYLLGAHSSSRDLFHHGGKRIISHGGGKSEALHSKNRRLEIKRPGDQLEDDRSVRALLNNYRFGQPLVILADDNYALFPYDLAANGYTYVVLGLYWITHAWAELQLVDENTSVVRYKFAFQWCEGQGNPWWQVRADDIPVVTQDPINQFCVSEPGITTVSPEERENWASDYGYEDLQSHITSYDCPSCSLRSPLVYQDTPICLQPRCALFCREVQAKSDPPSCAQTLSYRLYSTELLCLKPANHQPAPADSIFPPLPIHGMTTSRPFAKGIHCKDCGRLSTRFKWEDYECSHCHRIYEASRFVFNHKDFWLQEQSFKFHVHYVAEDSGIMIRNLQFQFREHGSPLPCVQTFDLPDNRGSVHLISGHISINAMANTLFQDYQKQAARGEIQFRRWPLRAHKCRGQLLSNYFSQNTGSPYQYIGGPERTTPLEDGAKAVLGALDLIKARIATALGKVVPFNEVLSAAYMEKQRMAFHSDNERGLGPIIASLSLGSAAEMHFRLHSKYVDADGHRKIAMSLLLKHGDVLVMEGANVQEYYEHAVVPKNFRIVATARLISPENYTTLGRN